MKKFLTFFTALTLLGSTMVKAADDIYIVAGTPNLFGSSWNISDGANKMTGQDGMYSLIKQNGSSAIDVEFKVVKNENWGTAYPSGNYVLSVPANAKVLITYKTSGDAVMAYSSMTVAGDNATLFGGTWNPSNTANDMVLQDNGTYKFEKNKVALSEGTVKFKACANHGWTDAWPSDNYSLSILESGNYTITITFNPKTLEVAATADLEEAGVVIPAIAMHGNFTGSWVDTENFTVAGNEETASLTLTGVTKGNYEFGVKIDGTWVSNGSAFTRDNNSYVISGSSPNCTFNADRNGDYTFTWTYATNTLAVTYPAVPAQSVTFNSLASEILKGSVINLANCVTSSGIDEPTYRFYIKEKNGEYGDAINANHSFNANGEYVVKVEALEYGEPVAEDESAVVVYQSYTFTNGSTIYVDFSNVVDDEKKGVNYPKVDQVGMDWDGEGVGTIKTITFTANVTWTTMAESFIKTEKNGWANLPFTVPGIGKNCAVVAADGASYTWTTLVPPPPTIKLHGDFTGSWANTDAFVVAGNKETASLSLTIPTKGTKNFGVRIGSDDNWTSNGAAITRASASASITAGEGNCSLNADIPGEYTFTWTYATNTLSVTYPDLPEQFVEFDGLASQVLKGTEVTFAATSTGITNPLYSYFVKPEGGEYGSAVAAYTFNEEGNFVVKVSAEGDNTAAPVVAEENVSVYDAHTFTSGTTIYVDFSAMTEGGKGVNYPSADAANAGEYDATGAGTVKTITFSADVTWTTNDVFIKTEKAGWDPGIKFSVPGDGENWVKVAEGGNAFTWDTYDAPVVSVEAKGGWDGWAASLSFTPAPDGQTATATLADLPAGNYAFKLIVGGGENWRSNENAFHRFWTSASGITENLDNMELQADADGDYVFTWTFATNALSIAFPENPKEGTNEIQFFAPRTEEHHWDNVYVYAWRRTAGDDVPLTEEWPGDPATKDGEWYKATIAKGACVIFHDYAGMQSFDIMNVQKDACYIANSIDDSEHVADPEKPIKARFMESCEISYYLTADAGIAGAGEGRAWNARLEDLKLEGNSITILDLPAGVYEFKITNGSWAWSLGGKEHLNTACSNGAATTGNGNVKFKLEDEQDVTISYDPATQKICLDAETVLPFEVVRGGLAADNYYTVCFNREMRQIRGASLWSFIGRDADFAYIVQESAPFEAGKPFILFAESEKLEAILDREVSEPVANGALHGTFEQLNQDNLDDLALATGSPIYLLSNNMLWRVTGDGTSNNRLLPGRAYLVYKELPSTGAPSAPGRRILTVALHQDSATGISEVQIEKEKAVKVLIDGQLYIKFQGTMYNVQGARVK